MKFLFAAATATLSTLVMHASAVPLGPVSTVQSQSSSRHGSSLPISFNNYNGLSSLSNFDNFYGVGNFGGSDNQIVLQQTEVVCVQQDVEVVQQQLAVLLEFAKSIITEEICQVDVQTIVFSQYLSGMQSFSNNLLHQSHRHVGYDSSVSSKISQMHDSNGNLLHQNLNFSGTSVGSNFVSPSGNDWNNQTSPVSAGSAYGLASAAGNLH